MHLVMSDPVKDDERVVAVVLSDGRHALVNERDLGLVSDLTWYPVGRERTYALHVCGGKRTMMHRLIMQPPASAFIDHWDGNGLNNTRSNLRVCTASQNMHNVRKKAGGMSRFRGVRWSWDPMGWRAGIDVNKKHISLGLYKSEEEAALAFDAAARKYVGEFCTFNFPLPGERCALTGVVHELSPRSTGEGS